MLLKIWLPQTKFDRIPSWGGRFGGFIDDFDADFLSIIGKVVVPCVANNLYESPDSTTVKGEKYTVTDKFYLASQREIFGTNVSTNEDDSMILPYYEGTTSTDKIKYLENVAIGAWTRTPSYTTGTTVRVADEHGANLSKYANNTNIGVVPVCTIV